MFQNHKVIENSTSVVMKIIHDHFKNIYSSYNVDLSNSKFLNQSQTPRLSEEDNALLDNTITLDECSSVIKTLSLNKTPGNDGIPIEFYITFWEEVGQILIDSYTYSLKNGFLTTSQRQAVISLIEKKGKDRLFINNWKANFIAQCRL